MKVAKNPIQAKLEQAIALHNAGDAKRASVLFLQVLKAHPDNIFALYSLAAIESNLGNDAVAINYAKRAAAVNPAFAQARMAHSVILYKLGKFEESLAEIEQVLALQPGLAGAQDHKQNVLIARKAGSLQPQVDTEAKTLNTTLKIEDRELAAPAEKIKTNDLADKELQSDNNSTKTDHLDLTEVMSDAESLCASGQTEAAIKLYQTWLEHSNSSLKHIAYFNLGVLFYSANKDKDAEQAYRAAISLNGDFTHPRINLGNALERQGRPLDAVAEWYEVINNQKVAASATDEMKTAALNQIGRVQENLYQYEQAEEALTKSLALNPDQPDVLHHWVHLRQKQCKWPVLQELPGVSVNKMLRSMSPLAMLAYADDPALQLLAAENTVRKKFNYPERNLSKGRKYQHDRIRVGYLSGDLCTHAVGLLLPEVFESHDKNKFEIYVYDYGREDGTLVRDRFKKAIEHFVPVDHLTDTQVAHRILEDEIDILVDLHGLSLGARPEILSYRPAPIQTTFLGYIGTTAMPWVNYVIADPYSLPEDLRPYFSEEPLYLGCTTLPGDSQREIGRVPTRAEDGLPDDKFVFASFNNAYKLNEQMFGCWMGILRQVPNSVLWLVDDNPWATTNLKKYAIAHGIGEERLIFSGRVPTADYRARMQLADLFLDNAPYNAGSTASDVVWMGLPLLTMSGRTFVSRMAGGLLNYAGLSELIAVSYEDYSAKAIQLALEPQSITKIREKLLTFKNRKGKNLATDFVRSLENALMDVHHQKINKPQSKKVIYSTGTTNLSTKKRLEISAGEPYYHGKQQAQASTCLTPIQTHELATKKDPKPTCALYQIAYSEQTLAAVRPPFKVLDNIKNPRPDWQEYWPIRNFLLNETLDENCLYGFFSPRFTEKTGLTPDLLEQFVKANSDNADVITISPQPDMGAFFLNVFEQNELFDPGFLQAAQEFVTSCGIDVHLGGLLMDSRTVVFSNYFVARPRFWRHWLDLNEKLFALCEAKIASSLQAAFLFETRYRNVQRKVFLMERIASLLLTVNSDYKVTAYDTFKCAWSSTKLGSLRSEAILSDALKLAKNVTKHEVYISEFARIRKGI
jgi:predicted O-linked N-acetylglucosamine transferase (SPINDLY family)